MTPAPDPATSTETALSVSSTVDTVALADVLNEFAATVTGEFAAHDILRQLAVAATRVLTLEGAGVMTPGPSGELLRTAFSSTAAVAEMERLQEALQVGPCKSCYLSGEIVDIPELAGRGEWPDYERRALDLGLHAVTAIPLLARGRAWGVLDLYRSAAVALSDSQCSAAATLANLATSYLVVTADRDTARDAQRELAHRAMHDPLTGLPARWVFLEQLGHALARLSRNPANVGLLFLDLDGLKQVNDTFGHLAGDRLIRTCVERIRDALRPADILARLGGDEFVVLLEQLNSPGDAGGVAQRILDELATPYRPDGHTIQPSASLGIAITDDPAMTAEQLIAHADAAMYRAKRGGRGRYETFDPVTYAADRAIITSRERLSSELETAWRRGELEVHYQPIYELSAPGGPDAPGSSAAPGIGAIALYAVEALARWRHPRRGLLTAHAFIDAAVRSGLIVELGAWVMDNACRQLTAWDGLLGRRAPPRMFVNIATAELTGPHLPERIADTLKRTGLPAARLTVEITEAGLITKPQAAARTVNALRRMGCELAIDDFGTGYSSLSRLMEFPVSILKIDQSFTRELSSNADAAAVVTAVLSLGTNLHRTVIVEGVESEETLRALRVLGATHVQGLHLGAPQPAGQLTAEWARG